MPLIISFTWRVSVVFLILTGEYAVFSHNCSLGFKPNWNTCFMITNKTFTWRDARRHCQESYVGADLASIYSTTDNKEIYSELYSQQGQAWIGLSDTHRTGLYNWTNGGSVVYTGWGTDEPTREEDGGCVSMHEDGKWYDDDCEELKKAVCKHKPEPSITPALSPEGVCPAVASGDKTWIKFNRHCYYFELNDKIQWQSAQVKCKELGGITASLVSIHDIQETHFIEKHVRIANAKPWIGLYQKSDGTYHWNDGSPLQFQRWSPGEPSSNKHCTIMSRHGQWYADWCHIKHGFVCKTVSVTLPSSTEKVCPGNNRAWERNNEHCYYFELNERIPWPAAQVRCKALGGETASLASIYNIQENHFIQRHISRASGNLWIGLYINSDRTTQWSDGSSAQFQSWAPGQPASQKEHCVQLSGSHEGFWNDIPCDRNYGYVCKTELFTHSEELDTRKCPENWQGHGSYCYYFQPNAYATLDMAKLHCKEVHNEAYLASVQDHYENTWIQSQMVTLSSMPQANDYWLGLHRTGSLPDKDTFQWTDNSELTFMNWESSEPRPGDGFKYCVEVDSDTGYWRSVSCATYRGYVCKMPKERSREMTGWQIAGIVIGVLLGVAVIITVLLFVCHVKKRNQGSEPFDTFTNSKSELASLDN